MTAASSLQKVTIAGVDVSDYVVSWRTVENIERSIQSAQLQLSVEVSEVLTLDNEQEVTIQRGKVSATEHYYFRGFIKTFTPKNLVVDISVENKLSQLEKRQVTNVYDKNTDDAAGVLSALVEDLVSTYGGLSVTVVDSSEQSRPLNVYPCIATDVMERVEQLRKVLDWLLRYDYENDLVVFEPKGHTVNSNVLRYDHAGTTNVLSVPKWESDSSDMVNKAHIIGKPQYSLYEESFASGSTVYTLTKAPEYVDVYEGATQLTLGIEDGGGSYDYTLNALLKQITLETAAADTITVYYSAAEPVMLTREDEESVAAYGLQEGSFYFEDVVNLEDAETRANEVLGRFSNPLFSTNVDVKQTSDPIRVGESIRFVDAVNGIDDYFIVNEVVHTWPELRDVLRLGQERHLRKNTLAETEERLQKLERRSISNIGVVNIVKDLNPAPVRVTGHMTVYSRDTSMDGAWGKGFGDGVDDDELPWGHADALWQGSYSQEPVVSQVLQDGGVYREDFSSTDFINTGSSTCTTGSGVITGSGASSSLVSSCIYCEKSSITTATIKAFFTGTSSFSLGLAPTAEGTPSWESVTLTSGTEATHTFTGTGNALFYKVDFTGTGTVSTQYNTDGGIAAWAVRITPS